MARPGTGALGSGPPCMGRNEPCTGSFNVRPVKLAAGVGCVVLISLSHGRGAPGSNLTALIAALVATTVVNQAAFTGVMALAPAKDIRRVARELLPIMAV